MPPASTTPVRITVRPSAGASRTTFAASFRAPRAGEDYSYKLTGPPGCSAVTGSFATRRELGVRGRRIAIPLSPAPGGRWCAGVWTVSVGLGTHNRSRTISPAGPTFGSARFTVRR